VYCRTAKDFSRLAFFQPARARGDLKAQQDRDMAGQHDGRQVSPTEKLAARQAELLGEQGCPGAWIEYSTVSTCARRRGDRIARRFPPLWSIEELEACFVVRDHSGQVLAYVR
jgi:hypothetical protein